MYPERSICVPAHAFTLALRRFTDVARDVHRNVRCSSGCLVTEGPNPSTFVDPAAPVEQVTWHEVQTFLARIHARGGGRFRLSTEAEWEYACRAGTTTPYAFGARLSTSQANYDGRYRESTVPVRSFPPNAWGLYDMHGNVWEWCATEYCPYPAEACGSKFKVIRGGSWYFGADSGRSAPRTAPCGTPASLYVPGTR